jgi:uncharacterized protein
LSPRRGGTVLRRGVGYEHGAVRSGTGNRGTMGNRVMNHDNYDDTYIRGILGSVKTIAMVGVSGNTSRPSYFAFKYLLERGYHAIPVNPALAGSDLIGQKAVGSLAEIAEAVDMIDIFRASEHAPAIVAQALRMTPRPKVIWMQLGVRSDEAARLAEDNGIKVVMNRCPKIEYGRLSSEISWLGVNSRTLSSRKARLSGRSVQRMSLNRSTLPGGTLAALARGPALDDKSPAMTETKAPI